MLVTPRSPRLKYVTRRLRAFLISQLPKKKRTRSALDSLTCIHIPALGAGHLHFVSTSTWFLVLLYPF